MFYEVDCAVVAQILDRLFVPGEAICLTRGFTQVETAPFVGGGTLVTSLGLQRPGATVEQCPNLEQLFLSLAVFTPGTTRDQRNCLGFRAIVLDLDVHNPWRKSASPYATYEAALDAIRVELADYPPHLIIDSGYGLQAWLLLEAVGTPDEGSLLRANAMANIIKGRLRADKINVSGLMRFPLSINAKGGGQPKRPTRILHAAPDAPCYHLEEMARTFGYVDAEAVPAGQPLALSTIDIDAFPEAQYRDLKALPEDLQKTIMSTSPDRSRQSFEFVRQLYTLGISVENAADLLCVNSQQQEKWRNRARLVEEVRRVYSKSREYEASCIHGMLPLNGTVVTEDDLDDDEGDL